MTYQFKIQRTAAAILAVGAFSLFCGISSQAATLYGVSASGQADYSVQTPTTVSTNPNSYSTGSLLPQISYSHPANWGGSQTSGSNSASAYVTTQSSSYGELHEGISATSSNPASGGGATASAFLEWEDTITFTGAPVGTPVSIQLTNAFDGSYVSTGTLAAGSGLTESALLFNNLGNINLTNSYTTNQPSLSVTRSGLLETTVGATLTLEEELTEYLSGTGTFSGSVNFSNTANVYLDVLTPGVSLVSASGASYSATAVTPASVPEPASMLLVAGGFIALGAAFRKR